MWLRIFQHILPNARAWRIVVEKTLRKFFEGLTQLPADVKTFYDLVFSDINPQLTRELDTWEGQFGLSNTVLTEQERRDRLDAAWAATGGQSPRYIQDTLQAAGFPVFIHEWWDPTALPAAVARDPLAVLNDGSTAVLYLSNDGAADMQDGDAIAQDGATLVLTGYALVNKILVPQTLGDGAADMQDGDTIAQDGSGVTDYQLKKYIVLNDPTTFPYFLYIGGQTFPDHAMIPSSRRNEFETLCLKICPAQQWLGILVDYT